MKPSATKSETEPVANSNVASEPVANSNVASEPVANSNVASESSYFDTVWGKVWTKVDACRRATGKRENCALQGPVELEGNRSVEMNLIPEGRDYIAIDKSIVVRIFEKDNKLSCAEQVAVELLDGLEGFAAKAIPITGGLPRGCEKRAMAMELRGDAVWSNTPNVLDRNFFLRLATLIEAIETLHEKGFVHQFIKGANIRIDRANPEFISLDGFNYTSPYIDFSTGKHHSAFSRRSDMESLTSFFMQAIADMPSWIRSYAEEMRGIPMEGRPDYEKWIAFFRAEAEKLSS